MSFPVLALAAQAVAVCDWPDEDEEFGEPFDLNSPGLYLTLDVRWAGYWSEGAGYLIRVASVEHDLSVGL